MPVIFSAATPGQVVVLEDPAIQAHVKFLSVLPEISVDSQLSIVTGVSVAEQTNHQFLHTLGGDIYVYVFGDRIGHVGIQGVSFAGRCDRDGHGMELLLRYYRQHRLSARRAPIQVILGDLVLEGFLLGVDAKTEDYRSRLSQYQLNLAIVPEREALPTEGRPQNTDLDLAQQLEGSPAGSGNAAAPEEAPIDDSALSPTGNTRPRGGAGLTLQQLLDLIRKVQRLQTIVP